MLGSWLADLCCRVELLLLTSADTEAVVEAGKEHREAACDQHGWEEVDHSQASETVVASLAS